MTVNTNLVATPIVSLPIETAPAIDVRALTIAGQHGATAAELQARGGHASQAAMAIYQHGMWTIT